MRPDQTARADPRLPAFADRLEDVRETERTARERLEGGCADEISALGRFFEKPLTTARTEAIDAMLGMGKPSDAELARNLSLEIFERIGRRCAERVCVNANLRFRARFRTYAQELARAEALLLEGLGSETRQRAKGALPRMFAIGRLAIDDVLLPDGPSDASDAEIGAWLHRLRRCVQGAMLIEIERAQGRVLESGRKRVAVVRARLALALHAPASGPHGSA